MTSSTIRCSEMARSFGVTPAVKGVSFSVPAGSTLAILGPSGCGKTTTLRLLAGFERLDAGEIEIGGDTVASPGLHLPPEQRRIGMVFQEYAIFPHLSVSENVAFGLNGRSSRAEKKAQVAGMLAFVGLDGLDGRLPHELSGGQQQRVALARALAPAPRALLLDEPFSNLDAALRVEVRAEVRQLLRQGGTTTVFVTHDQDEAMFFGDSIAVMRAGSIEQIGTAEEVYLRPQTRFVAAFMGQTDFIPGRVNGSGVDTPLGRVAAGLSLSSGTLVEVALRPNQVTITTEGTPNGRILTRQFLGMAYLYRLALVDGQVIHSWQPHTITLPAGGEVHAGIQPGPIPPIFHNGRSLEVDA